MTSEDQQALRCAMAYWAARWNWESQTLFGIELDDLQGVLSRWSDNGADDHANTLLVSVGAVRELLYGASAAPKDTIEGLIGISFDRAEELLGTLLSG